ncbi:hypothetical protein Strain138_002135 [Pseudogemmatithrix spongiicola]|uniref:Uncharacterized protein n=1 Tax=Pseudogemmatithrix spongiicola TaxID=3062599 RepID=A0AA49Q846_9BACT|nr:hypothetical protein Strain138_002135 [Gemmatimonadaceae bacterium 'strain 138']WKW15732.1 hypothetical protein Strain318_002134 [Gemmatimonadaceae bacterium 'strain 318']
MSVHSRSTRYADTLRTRSMPSSFVALIGPLTLPPNTRHTLRVGDAGVEQLMPPAQLVLLEVEDLGYCQLYRYTLDGTFAGDTWHQSRGDAEHQARFEFGDALGEWHEFVAPDDDSHEAAIEWARRMGAA